MARYLAHPSQQATPLPIYHSLQQATALATRLRAEPLASTTHPYQDAARWPINQSLALAQQLALLTTGYRYYADSEDPFLEDTATWLEAYAHYLAHGGEYPVQTIAAPRAHNPYAPALEQALCRLTAFHTTQEVRDGA